MFTIYTRIDIYNNKISIPHNIISKTICVVVNLESSECIKKIIVVTLTRRQRQEQFLISIQKNKSHRDHGKREI